MYSRIPEHIIEEIRSRADIVDVVSEHVALKKRGKNFFGVCPFHQEKTPSFSVSPERQIYRCFSCGAGGNVFKFLMELEQVSFVEALRSLADKTGIQLPNTQNEQEDPNDEVYQINQFVLDYYHQVLLQTNTAKHAREYLTQRQVDNNLITTFKLGYAPESWDDVLKLGRKKGFDDAAMVKAGVVIRNDNGRVYNRFRNRLMFPIFQPSGRVIAFGGRTLGDDVAKYMNSPETPIYHKSNVLYGLNWAKGTARHERTMIVAEGYMDMMRIYAAGFKNVVAASGTAFTPQQAQLIGRYADKVLIVYDSDAAGQEATIRGLDVLVQAGLGVGVVSLDEGKDPDEYIIRKGAEAFGHALTQAADIIDYKIAYYGNILDISTVDGKLKTVREIMSTVEKVRDPIRRSLLVKKVSEKFGLEESIIQKELTLETPSHRAQSYHKGPPSHHREAPPLEEYGPLTDAEEEEDIETPLPREEIDIVCLLVSHPEIAIKGETLLTYVHNKVDAQEFTHPACEAIVTNIYQRYKEQQAINVALLIEEMTPALKQQVLVQSLIDDDDIDLECLLLDNIAHLKKKRISREEKRLQGELKIAQGEGDADQVTLLIERLMILTKEKLKVLKK